MNIFAIRKNAARCIVLGLLFSFTAPFQAAYAGSVNLTVSAGEQPQQQAGAQTLPLEQLVLRAFESDASRAFDLNTSILDEHAAKELQLDWVANTLDRTQTYVGSNRLAQSLNPTNDVEEIERRQLLIKTFIDDAHMFNAMDIALHDIAKNEQAVLSYWNEKDALWLNASRL